MRAFCVLVGLLVLSGAATARNDERERPASPERVACELVGVTHDWDFSVGDQGFQVVDCDAGGIPAWQYGPTESIPGAPPRVWGTVLNGDYPNNAGGGLVSPPFVVTPESGRLEVYHCFDTEPGYDGGNVSVGVWPSSQIIHPIGGYNTSEISPGPLYNAFCVNGEPGWTGHDATWRLDCFDLSAYLGQEVRIEFDFGSDASVTAPGWYLGRVRVGSPLPPPGACCNLATGACTLTNPDACMLAGGEWHPEWSACEPNPCPQPIPDAHLRLGDWFNPEPWNDWIAANPGSSVEVEVHPGEVAGHILAVEFFHSPDHGRTWQAFGFDDDGAEPRLDTYDPTVHPTGNGWSAVATFPETPPSSSILFKALVHTDTGTRVVTEESEVDGAPPSLGRTNIEEWQVTEQDTMGVDWDPNGAEITRIIAFRSRLIIPFQKGIPGISQQEHSEHHCAPTAAAQCLKYFETQGDTTITAGLTDYQLVGALAGAMHTSFVSGTAVSAWTGGMTSWVQSHGAGYTVRTMKHYDDDNVRTWISRDWRVLRNELQRCQNVLLGLFWTSTAGGGHTVTLDAIVNTPLPNGRILLGFKDPWTGQTATGQLDTQTGDLYDITGAGNGGTAYVGATMIVCPAESTLAAGGPGEPVFDGLPVGAPPYIIPIPLPEPGPWFVHLVAINSAGHAYRVTRVVVRAAPGAAPDSTPGIPVAFDLAPPAPNPFGTSTEISYSLPKRTPVTLQVFDVTGRTVRTLVDGEAGPGVHRVRWDGTDQANQPVTAGVYYLRVRTPAQDRTRSVTLLR
jgi:hypothetical protein